MIHVTNKAVMTTPVATSASGTTVPFDTIVLNTNGNLDLLANTIQEKVTGVYDTICQVCVENTSTSAAATVTLKAFADGKAIDGAFVKATVPSSSGAQFLTINWPVNVVAANTGTASISWQISGGVVNIVNANATVFRHV